MGLDRREMNRSEKSIRKDERKKVRKKRGAKKTLIGTGVVGALLFLLLGSGYVGLNPFGIRSDGSGELGILQNSSKKVEEKGVSQTAHQKIVVEGETCYYEAQSYTVKEMIEIIEKMKVTDELLDLVDKVAVAKAFDEIEKALQAQGIEYKTVEDY